MILGILFWIERRAQDAPDGIVIASAGALWGLDRFLDEVFWLAVPQFWDLVEIVGLVMCAASLVAIFILLRRHQRNAEPVTVRAPGDAVVARGPG